MFGFEFECLSLSECKDEVWGWRLIVSCVGKVMERKVKKWRKTTMKTNTQQQRLIHHNHRRTRQSPVTQIVNRRIHLLQLVAIHLHLDGVLHVTLHTHPLPSPPKQRTHARPAPSGSPLTPRASRSTTARTQTKGSASCRCPRTPPLPPF